MPTTEEGDDFAEDGRTRYFELSDSQAVREAEARVWEEAAKIVEHEKAFWRRPVSLDFRLDELASALRAKAGGK